MPTLLVHIIIAACANETCLKTSPRRVMMCCAEKWQLLAWLWLHHQMGLLDRPTDCLCVCASKSNVKNNEDVLYNEESDAERPSRRFSLLQHHTPPSQGKKIESFIPLILSRVAVCLLDIYYGGIHKSKLESGYDVLKRRKNTRACSAMNLTTYL